MGILDVGVYALKNVQQWYMLVSCIWNIPWETYTHVYSGGGFMQVDK